MRPTVEYIEHRFNELNRLMFGGKLPHIPISLSNAKTYLGQCVSCVRTHSDGTREHYDFKLRFSTHLDLPADTIDDTIIHEMIHYFIHYNGLTDTSTHGAIFKSLMHSINVNYHRNLTISHKSTPEQRNDITRKPKLHIISIITLHNGKLGLKVLPRAADSVINFFRQAIKSPGVSSVELYLHDDPFFDRYPTSAALRYHSITSAELMPHLLTAKRLKIAGTGLIYDR